MTGVSHLLSTFPLESREAGFLCSPRFKYAEETENSKSRMPFMPTELPKQYDPKEAQTRWLRFWEERGFARSDPDNRKPFTIVIPPPNVTGRCTWATPSTTRCRTS